MSLTRSSLINLIQLDCSIQLIAPNKSIHWLVLRNLLITKTSFLKCVVRGMLAIRNFVGIKMNSLTAFKQPSRECRISRRFLIISSNGDTQKRSNLELTNHFIGKCTTVTTKLIF